MRDRTNLLSFFIQIFWSSKNRYALFSDSLEEALKDVFKEMGYHKDEHIVENPHQERWDPESSISLNKGRA